MPPIQLDTKDIINILAEYDVEHTQMRMFCQQFYGATSFNSKLIELCSSYDTADKRETILHELLHIAYHQHFIETGGPYEGQIDAMAKQWYAQLYGVLPTLEPVQPAPSAPAVETPPANP